MSKVSRRYGGRDAADRVAERRARLLAAGLDLMGTRGAAATTVRGVTETSGVAPRYFYESFTDIEALHIAVFDQVIEEGAQRSVAALKAAPDPKSRTRAVLAEMVDLLLADPRKGRILLLESTVSPALSQRRLAEIHRFAGMLASTAATGDPELEADGLPTDIRLISHFLIGGVYSTIGSVLLGDVVVEREHLVDVLVALFESVRAPAAVKKA